jgi:hypothetical protein
LQLLHNYLNGTRAGFSGDWVAVEQMENETKAALRIASHRFVFVVLLFPKSHALPSHLKGIVVTRFMKQPS